MIQSSNCMTRYTWWSTFRFQTIFLFKLFDPVSSVWHRCDYGDILSLTGQQAVNNRSCQTSNHLQHSIALRSDLALTHAYLLRGSSLFLEGGLKIGEGGDRNKEASGGGGGGGGREIMQPPWWGGDKNQLVISCQIQHYITINEIIFA